MTEVIRANIQPPTSSACSPCLQDTLHSFNANTLQELFHTISHTTSSSPLDVIPIKFLLKALDSLAPFSLSVINGLLSSGCVPDYLQTAGIQSLLKKPGSDPSVHNNDRTTAKLPFLSKSPKKVVSNQLSQNLISNNILDKFQSWFRHQHSTENALVRVINDILMKAGTGDCTVLLLLDVSAAFDPVDHDTLIEQLRSWVGVWDTALWWFISYLSNIKCVGSVNGFNWSDALSPYGVPQGSILGPLLFSLGARLSWVMVFLLAVTQMIHRCTCPVNHPI